MTTARPIMPIESIPDWEKRLARQDAFWRGEVLDRPVCHIALSKPVLARPWPVSKHPTHRERWMDFGYTAECALAGVMNTDYLGDALPHVDPNLGPEVFSAFMGSPLEFGEITSWSIPILHDWKEADKIRFTPDNAYWKKLNELTDILLEAGKGRFYVGLTDFHPGGDAIAAFRDPLNFNIDMIEARDEVKALLRRVTDTYLHIFDLCYAKLAAARQATTSWAGIVSTRKWYVPSNDFSCMISKETFDDVFLPGIVEECRALEASIYHLDGPNALQHLDSLLSIPELNAIQWVAGAGHGSARDWLHLYKKCQAAGKGLQIALAVDEVDLFMRELRPNGLWLSVYNVKDREQAEAILKKMLLWK